MLFFFKNEQCGERFQLDNQEHIHADIVVKLSCGNKQTGLSPATSMDIVTPLASMCPQVLTFQLRTPCICSNSNSTTYNQWSGTNLKKLDANATVEYSFLTTMRKAIESSGGILSLFLGPT
jgi:hypothetical protein